MKNLGDYACPQSLHEVCLNLNSEGSPCASVCDWLRHTLSTSEKKIPTAPRVVILQHPQEPGESLGSAWLGPKLFPKLIDLQIGLSRKSVSHLVGIETSAKDWAIIYPKATDKPDARGFTVYNLKGRPEIPAESQAEALKKIKGFVILDGTWSQSKTLWWRNPWVLKSVRISLHPTKPSKYGVRRKEPQKSYLSTLESIAHLYRCLGRTDLETKLLEGFDKILEMHPVRTNRSK